MASAPSSLSTVAQARVRVIALVCVMSARQPIAYQPDEPTLAEWHQSPSTIVSPVNPPTRLGDTADLGLSCALAGR